MKILLLASYKGLDNLGPNYKKIYDYVIELGNTPVDNEMVSLSYDDFVKKMDTDPDASANNYKLKMKQIQAADVCIFEVSNHSLGVGFMIERSIQLNKPTIVLYYKQNKPYFISGVEDDKLILKSYNDKNLKKIVKDTLELAKERRDKRFNFFLSPKLLEYLERASSREGVTKSKLIRDMIVRHMRDNVDGA
ncbi:hypothetical protein HGA88_06965 [Candidatus Roizmanbacteria bacterium]|nr:hypothetical protein [Candidatus Roizmanbacteria bacterium]